MVKKNQDETEVSFAGLEEENVEDFIKDFMHLARSKKKRLRPLLGTL